MKLSQPFATLAALKDIWFNAQSAVLLLWKDPSKDYERLLELNNRNNLFEIKRLASHWSGIEKKTILAKIYSDYFDFLESIRSLESLKFWVSSGLDLNKQVVSEMKKRLISENLPQKAPALFFIFANDKNERRFELFSWALACGANVHARDILKGSILQLLLNEYTDCLRFTWTDKIEEEKMVLKFVEVLRQLKFHHYDFSEHDPVSKEYTALSSLCYAPPDYIYRSWVFEFLLGELKDINYAPLIREQFLEGMVSVANTVFVEAANIDTVYVDMLLKKYKDNAVQLQEFQKQISDSSTHKTISAEDRDKLYFYIERAKIHRDTPLSKVSLVAEVEPQHTVSSSKLLEETVNTYTPKKKILKI